MRSPGEEIVTAPESLTGRFAVQQAELAAALAAADLRFVSCLRWRVGPEWSIPKRRLADTFVFLPLDVALTVAGPAGAEALVPGRVAIIPHGVASTIRYVDGCRGGTVIALHAHLLTAWGAPWPYAGGSLVATLPEPVRWDADLTRLAGLAQDHPALGRALGRLLVSRLLTEAVLAGHPLPAPGRDLDPRLAAIVAQVQADPGGAPSIATLARAHGIGPLRLRQLCHAGLGCAPKAFVDRLRLARAAELLRAGAPVGEVARSCGFASRRQLQVRFKAAYGVPPSDWATGGTGP